ncbi:MAG: DUF4276 family protein [Acidobacteria bacterium]|nr:DUF4276 family protein [Acidobacteriota bacterium]
MVKAKIYVEGGGDSKEQQARCREGFQKLIAKAGFPRPRSPAIVACGSRRDAYDRFKIAVSGKDNDYAILLVDSEEPVENPNENIDSDSVWKHLKICDGWQCPTGAANDQAQLMVTCMETWIMADHQAIKNFFGQHLQINALYPAQDLEARSRHEVQDRLHHATRNCGRDRVYAKGKKSFQIMGELNPETLKRHLPHFRRFITTLDLHL